MGASSIHWLWNGRSFEEASGIPFSDRGFRYGMAVFETIRITSGQPDFWDEHCRALSDAMHRCGFSVEANALEEAERLFPLTIREGVLRIYVTAGDGGPADPPTACRMALVAEERIRRLPEEYRLGLESVLHTQVFPGLKTANYWRNAESLRAALNRGEQEALLFGADGSLTGACMANVFLKTDGVWLTPSAAHGARAGVVRAWVLERLNAHEASIHRTDVTSAEALFLTSSWLGVMPAATVGSRQLAAPPAEVQELRSLWEQRA